MAGTQSVATNPRLEGVHPDDLRPSDCHVRRCHNEVSETFIRNVEQVGLAQPPVACYEGDGLAVVDGVRRAKAAAAAGLSEIPVVVYEMSDSEAMQASLTANLDPFRKQVSGQDEEAAMRVIGGGPRRALGEWERDDAVFDAKEALGLVTEADRIHRVIGEAKGVGEAACIALAEAFESVDAIRAANIDELQRADGIGPTTASAIRAWLDSDHHN